MNDGDPRYLEPRSNHRAAGGSRWFQFSLTSLFVIVTVTALILSAFFSVGRLLGMSNMEVLTQGLETYLFPDLPRVMVWIVGLMIAVRRRKGNRAAVILTMIALGAMVLNSLVYAVVYMALAHTASSGGISLAWILTALEYLSTIIEAVCWVLILVAVFARRPPDAPETEGVEPGEDPRG